MRWLKNIARYIIGVCVMCAHAHVCARICIRAQLLHILHGCMLTGRLYKTMFFFSRSLCRRALSRFPLVLGFVCVCAYVCDAFNECGMGEDERVCRCDYQST